jgi:Na+/H+ antiporter NhaC
MRAAEARAAQGTPEPPGSENVTLLEREHDSVVPVEKARLINFLLPIGVLIIASWLPGTNFAEGVWIGEIDAIKGVLAAIVVTSVLFLFQRLTSPQEFSEVVFSGFRSMIYPLAIVVMSFVLVEVNGQLGLTDFVIETVRPLMTGALFPAVAFIACALICFMTGSYWGTFAIALPIIIPLAQELNTSVPLAIGAVVSAGAFGSHMCPFGDATVLSSAASGCNNLAHVRTQMPYGLICGALSVAGFVALGVVMG